jgi:hypothetical protein
VEKVKGELWQLINDYEPSPAIVLELAELQQLIQEGLTEVYCANISYPHFLERKDDFHDAMRKEIHLKVSNTAT